MRDREESETLTRRWRTTLVISGVGTVVGANVWTWVAYTGPPPTTTPVSLMLAALAAMTPVAAIMFLAALPHCRSARKVDPGVSDVFR